MPYAIQQFIAVESCADRSGCEASDNLCVADVSDQTDPDTTATYEGDFTPQERFQRNPGVFTSKERVPPLVLESGANGSMRQEGADQEDKPVCFNEHFCGHL